MSDKVYRGCKGSKTNATHKRSTINNRRPFHRYLLEDDSELIVGPNMLKFCLETDANRVRSAEHNMFDIAKEARRIIISAKKKQKSEIRP